MWEKAGAAGGLRRGVKPRTAEGVKAFARETAWRVTSGGWRGKWQPPTQPIPVRQRRNPYQPGAKPQDLSWKKIQGLKARSIPPE